MDNVGAKIVIEPDDFICPECCLEFLAFKNHRISELVPYLSQIHIV